MKSAVLVTFGLIFTLFTLSAAVAAPPPGLAKYQAARAEFDRMVADAEAGKGEMPRLSDPKAAEILRTLSDVDAVLGTQTYEWSDYSTLSDMCVMATPFSSYLGPKLLPPRKGVKQDAETRARELRERREIIDRKIITYQDEITLLNEFSLECRHRLIPLFEEMVSGLEQGSNIPLMSEKNMYQRVMIFQAVCEGLFIKHIFEANAEKSEIRPKNVRRLLKVGAGVADQYARIFSEKQRSTIIAAAEGVRPTLEPEAQANLDIIVKAMQRTECEGLCSFPRQ